MVTDALKRSRELLSYGLLAVAGLYLVSGLSLLFKSEDAAGLNFADKSAAFGYLFASPVLTVCLVAAVALVTGLGELASTARVVVLVALVIAGLALVLAVITLLASLGADKSGFGAGLFGGVLGAGKIVGVLLGSAQLLLLGLAAWFIYQVLRGLPVTGQRPPSGEGSSQTYVGSSDSSRPAWNQRAVGQGASGGSRSGRDRPSPPGEPSSTGQSAVGWTDPYQGHPEQQGLPASQWLQPQSAYQPDTAAAAAPDAVGHPDQDVAVEGDRPAGEQSWWDGRST
jgi:hypothetical protein